MTLNVQKLTGSRILETLFNLGIMQRKNSQGIQA